MYVGSDDGNVYALDAVTGTRRWLARVSHGYHFAFSRSSPTVLDGTVYIGSNDGQVHALDAATGTPRWLCR